ncbi:hypothetical protein B0H13DRAFT_1883076 [Mycena leptocephala]|nr:hypothetical protein B0H13DRAFT_1883076 [Mycena leptocephala]
MGKAWRLRGGAHSSKSWTSETHIVDLGLNISQPSDNYAVQILTEITFTVQQRLQHQTEDSQEERPQFTSQIKFQVSPENTRDIESDRSYTNICFLVQGMHIWKIEEEPHPDFVPPRQINKQVATNTLQGTFGGTATGPVGNITWGGTKAREHQNDKPTPNCTVYYNRGGSSNDHGRSCKSLNITCVAEDIVTSKESLEGKHPMKVIFSAGIHVLDKENTSNLELPPTTSFLIRSQTNLWIRSRGLMAGGQGIVVLTSAYIPDVRAPGQLYIEETPEIKLCGKGLAASDKQSAEFPAPDRAPENSSVPRAVFIGLSSGPKPQNFVGRLKETVKAWPKFLGLGTQEKLYLHECIARGWDLDSKEWRMPVWPRLTSNLEDTSKSKPAYELEAKDLSQQDEQHDRGQPPTPPPAAKPITKKGKGKESKLGAKPVPALGSNSKASIDGRTSGTARARSTRSPATVTTSLTPFPTTPSTSVTSFQAPTKTGGADEEGNASAGPSKNA